MSEKSLQKQIAKLESLNDQLQAEQKFLDDLLKRVGFEKGIATLKDAAFELLDKQDRESSGQE